MVTQQLQERLQQLYKEMKKQGNLCRGTYKADSFPYVTIQSELAPEGVISKYGSAFGFTIASESEQRAIGLESMFGHCEAYLRICNEQKRLMFVVSDLVPEEFRNPPAVHLYIQGYYEITLKDAAYGLATKAEFEQAQLQGLEFIVHYTKWWIETMKEKLQNASKKELEALRKLLPSTPIVMLRDAGYL